MARRIVAGTGRTLIALGVLMLLFVAYQLWGTNLAEASSQNSLRQQLDRQLARPTPTTTLVPTAAPTTTTVPPLEPVPGGAVGRIQIPKIGVDKVVVEGVGEEDLKRGPGHYPETPLPGQPGNAAIAGHRTTYGAPFYNLNELVAGDPIYITTAQGRFEYTVTGSQVVAPTDVAVVAPTTGDRLTLTTCNPRFSAAQRLVVSAQLDLSVSPAVAPPHRDVANLPPGKPVEASLNEGSSGAIGPSVGWGLGASAVWLAAWVAARRWRRRWLPYLVGVLPFLVLLFFFFENVSRLLPTDF
ncbi:MAG TPA: class E sortase [Acidimicrobiales bacterium]|nr:class E sortase [Acidimicrobiales bacterium]